MLRHIIISYIFAETHTRFLIKIQLKPGKFYPSSSISSTIPHRPFRFNQLFCSSVPVSMESLRGFSNLSSSVEVLGESGTCCGSSNSVRRGIVVGMHSLKNGDLCRAQRIRCAAVATERRTVPVPSGNRSNNDQSLLHVLDRMRDSGRGQSGSVFDFGSKVADKEEDVSSKLDHWVRESVHEILNSLDEAPFLMQIYSDGGEEGGVASTKSSSRLVKVKAGPNSWPLFRDRWNNESNSPNGVILVGEIDTDEVNCGGDIGVFNRSSSSFRRSPSTTKVWGILIQGKGGNYPACYMLKTSKVKGVTGVCTHFCLARVECFVEHVDILFKKLWLL